ncbi:cytochrome c oxidase subunit II [Flavobacterium enshiense DK69]|uniref:Cytochrome c oxidase subunit 2 n=1 Tax=Flavobacterium enshiense DK69 TaxID=1107311 RepID=V6SFK5_9FLAO|nr:cytochrome c oxidase subunit II [Flavobacterium enshiense]ESU23180.1 cytochrome c oxidase subunit II [Flavobacterium enshiense DK69]KGO96582.1 cytochrome C oxidase subunit II [Flavobacterium enshiense DK69]
MTSLLVLTVVVLLGIAVWQLTKIFDLTQIGAKKDNSEIANDNDNNVNGYLMFAFLVFIYLTTIYCVVKFGDLPLMSNPASEHGADYDNLMWISMVLIFVVQTITQALLHYFAFKYRGKQGNKALYFADNDKLEFIWTIIPVIVLAGLILYGLYAWTNIMFVDEEEDVMYVELYGKQFSWEARYAGKDNTLGKANVRYIEGVNTLGVDMSDPNSQDDKQVTEIHLPVGKKVVFKIRSQDVLHSAYFPHFRAQMNAVPGMVTQFAFTPTMTTDQMRNTPEMVEKVARINKIRAAKSQELVAAGKTALDPYTFDYLLLCNKICGPSHFNMQMKVIVESEADYKKWLSVQPLLSRTVSEAKAKEAPATDATVPAVKMETVKVDTTKVVAQVK